MNNEFKKSKNGQYTVYTLESATGGGTSAGAVASVSSPMGGVRKRGDNLIAQEANTDKIDASKPRNFVAKNAKTGGAGAHKDKKKAAKQGDAKHKNKDMDMAEGSEQQYAVTIDAIDHGVLAPVTVVAGSSEEAKQKAIAGVKASMIKRGYELMVRSVSAKPKQGVAEGLGKSIKRASQGWGVGAAPDMVTPSGAVSAFKNMDGQRLANFVASRKDQSKPRKNSAGAFVDKVIDREMRQRGYGRVANKDEQGVAEGFPKDPNAPKLVQDRKTGKWYDPNKEFKKKMTSPEVMAQMKRMAQKEGVAEVSLNELAPSSGSEGNSPFDYGSAIIQIGQDFINAYDDDSAGEDAAEIIKVGKTFMSAGMKPGIAALFALDTQVYEHVLEQLSNQGFNVRADIISKRQPTKITRSTQDKWQAIQDKFNSQPGNLYQVTGYHGYGSLGQKVKALSPEEAEQKFIAANSSPKTQFNKIEVSLVKGVAEGERMKTASGMYRDQHTGVAYRGKTGQDGNDSYMTPDYLIQKYQERLAQIASGPYKRPKEVAQLKSRIAKLQGKQGVAEGSESPEKELERLKLRQNAEHGRASLQRQSATQARIRELEKAQSQGTNEGMGEIHQEIGEIMDRFIEQYKNGMLDADHLMHIISKASEKFAARHNIDPAQAQELISNYVEDKAGDKEAVDEYMESLARKLAEKIPANAPTDVWVQDFQKADPNKYHQFKNKTPAKKAQMAVAASYAAKNPSKK